MNQVVYLVFWEEHHFGTFKTEEDATRYIQGRQKVDPVLSLHIRRSEVETYPRAAEREERG